MPLRGWGRLLAVATLVAGCASPPYAHNDEVSGLVQAYRQQSARAVQTASPYGISALAVEPVDGRPGEFVVSADLHRAPLKLVVERLFEQSRVPYFIQAPALVGRVTGRFEKHPFLDMLSEILRPNGYVAQPRDGLLVIAEAPSAPAVNGAGAAPGSPPGVPGAEASAPIVARGAQLRHLDIESATKFFEGLFPVDPRTGARPITWAVQPYTSTIFVSGPRSDAMRALQLLEEMDRDPAHVLIEALVVELDTNELERFGTDLSNFLNVQLSALSSGVGGAVNTGLAAPNFPSAAAPAALRFLYTQGANNPRTFAAVIDVLASQDKARVIARPYMASVSGRQAAIQIQRERTVAVVTGGTTTSDTETIPSGVILNVTPWVLEGDRVRLDVQVEQSTFVQPPPAGVLVEKDANKAQTSMQVRSGQSVIIGGLSLQETFSSNGGLPWLRNIPGLSLVTAKQSSNERKQDVLIFVTPYIWTPTVDPPIPHPDAFKFREEDELTAIEQWKKRWIKP
jgi:type II secretory pathway component GspD/PulD (secretin)